MTADLRAAATPMRRRIARQSGTALELRCGDLLTVVDPFGEQVADVTAFSSTDHRETLSPGRTIDYAGSIYITTGAKLYSNRSGVLFTIVEDTVGRHDILLTPCSDEMFRILYDAAPGHPSCFGNLCHALEPYGVRPDDIAGTFNVFMNVEVGADGTVSVLPPRSRPGDRLTLRAERDVVVGVTACSAELSNNGTFTPIDIEVVGGS
ncbi:MAG: DUF1989 domain-containing protein [Candidatus Dormibacteria bacterium]